METRETDVAIIGAEMFGPNVEHMAHLLESTRTSHSSPKPRTSTSGSQSRRCRGMDLCAPRQSARFSAFQAQADVGWVAQPSRTVARRRHERTLIPIAMLRNNPNTNRNASEYDAVGLGPSLVNADLALVQTDVRRID
jgi:hypothetical protein